MSGFGPELSPELSPELIPESGPELGPEFDSDGAEFSAWVIGNQSVGDACG